MPFFSPKTWKQRIVEFPGRRRLDDTSSADVYDVSRAEGTVTQEGDGFTAANMNDLEQRINNAVNDVAGLSADEYDPNATYSSGDLRIHDNILHKANQDISVAETWTPAHWTQTTLAAELSAVNSRIQIDAIEISIPKGSAVASSAYRVGDLIIFSVAFNVATTINENENFIQFSGISAKSRFDFAIRDSSTIVGDGALLAGTNGIIANSVSLNPGGYFCAGAFVVN